MNAFLKKLGAMRKQYLDGLDANKGSINLDIFEDFYPDKAHFVFELLQNAEDAGATEAEFKLNNAGCMFEHNGTQPFTADNVVSITGINHSPKRKSPNQIGKFGVGFKSVFVYTSSPVVHSGDFSFQITRLVMPEPVARDPKIKNKTCFWLPFNNPKMPPEIAHSEVKAGLQELPETTLLFLAQLKSIRWKVEGETSGAVLRIQHPDHHFEVLKQVDGKATTSSHFLKFEQTVEGLDKQRAAVAFALGFIPNTQQLDPPKAISKQFRIVPATPGRVAVYFPAEKETSGLRFHLHAPFVPELSRASIKETPANQPLFAQLATLTAKALHQIRDLDLLTMEFLGVLPNPQDNIPSRYECIMVAIIEEMNAQPLTPALAGTHAPARRLLQGKRVLKELLSEEDLKFLVDYENEPPLWAMAAPQKNSNTDRFLSGLAITDWDVNEFIELFCQKSTTSYGELDEDFMAWLAGQSLAWHQQFYALLYSELEPEGNLDRLEGLNLVRLSNSGYSIGRECFFPSEGSMIDDMLPRVDVGVYTSGKNKTQQENARKLLEAIGVREVGEAEQIEAILKQRYADNFKPMKQDLTRFVAFLEREPDRANLFSEYLILQGSDGKWRQPAEVFLDLPFRDTGLSTWYAALGKEGNALNAWYQSCKIKIERVTNFAKAVGAQTYLEIKKTRCDNNPQWDYLESVGGDRYTSPINQDFHILHLEELLNEPSFSLSKLVWETMRELPPNCLYATYQRNSSWGAHTADSQLVHCLRSTAWVPQAQSKKVVFVRPAEAFRDKLPEGFQFDAGWKWLKAIHFGQEVAKRSDEQTKRQEMAKELGFADTDSALRGLLFASLLPPEEQEQFLAEVERRRSTKLPENEPANPNRRTARILGQAAVAPERQTEPRTRSVSVEREAVKKDTNPYLRQQYTNSDSEMICQICKGVLPFKLTDGTYYFEAVEFLPELRKRHYQNYLALCPNHAAMFQYANGSRERLMASFLNINANNLEVVLADRDMTIYFTRTHILDLKAVIGVDQQEEGGE